MAERREILPAFFDQAPVIWMRDPLARFLGAASDGALKYTYTDAVRLAGHSCPTVAGAHLMVRAALQRLYGDEIPERGNIRVEIREAAQEGVAGVIAAVLTLITGATADTGFRGIAGQFSRRNLLTFEAPIKAQFRFTRLDTGRSVSAAMHPERVEADPRRRELIALCLQGRATDEQVRLFQRLWQDGVRRLLLEHADDPEIFEIA